MPLYQSFARTIYARDYGAIGDAITRTDGVTTLNSSTFTSAAGTFVAADIGKTLLIQYGSANATLTTALVSAATITSLSVTAVTNAYASGAAVLVGIGATTQTFTTTAAVIAGATSIPVTSVAANANYAIGIPIDSAPLSTTITAVASLTSITLSVIAKASTTSDSYIYGTENTTAIQNAINITVPSGAAVKVMLGSGYFLITGTITNNTGAYLLGDGYLQTVLYKCSLAQNYFSLVGSGSRIEGMAIKNIATPTSGATISITGGNCLLKGINISPCWNGIDAGAGSAGLFMDNILMSFMVNCGLYVHDTNDIYIQNFLFDAGTATNATVGCIRLFNKVEAFMAINGDIIHGAYSMTTDATSNTMGNRPAYAQFTNVEFDSAANGPYLKNTVLFKFSQCWFSNRPGYGAQVDGTCYEISFLNCMFINSGGHGLVILAGSLHTKVIGCSFLANNSQNNGSNAITVTGGTTDFVITGNTISNGTGFTGVHNFGILVDTGASDRYIVKDNIINGTSSVPFYNLGTGVNNSLSDKNGMLGAIKTAQITSDVANANATASTYADITGLSFAVAAGVSYHFQFIIPYTAAIATTGALFSLNGPTTTLLSFRVQATLTATTESASYYSAYNITTGGTATSLVAANLCIIEGVLTTSAAGTIIARFASKVASSAITAKAGSCVQWWQA